MKMGGILVPRRAQTAAVVAALSGRPFSQSRRLQTSSKQVVKLLVHRDHIIALLPRLLVQPFLHVLVDPVPHFLRYHIALGYHFGHGSLKPNFKLGCGDGGRVGGTCSGSWW